MKNLFALLLISVFSVTSTSYAAPQSGSLENQAQDTASPSNHKKPHGKKLKKKPGKKHGEKTKKIKPRIAQKPKKARLVPPPTPEQNTADFSTSPSEDDLPPVQGDPLEE